MLEREHGKKVLDLYDHVPLLSQPTLPAQLNC